VADAQKPVLKTFKTDRLVRDASGRPLGRLVLAADYVEGQNIVVALMDIPRVKEELAKSQVYYVDGLAYRVPGNLPSIKFTAKDNRLIINNFFLMREA